MSLIIIKYSLLSRAFDRICFINIFRLLDFYLKHVLAFRFPSRGGCGRVVRWCWVNFQYRGILLLDKCKARAYCACSRCGWGFLDNFSLVHHFSFISPSLWETARYRLNYCNKGPFSPKQPTNLPSKMPANIQCIIPQIYMYNVSHTTESRKGHFFSNIYQKRNRNKKN